MAHLAVQVLRAVVHKQVRDVLRLQVVLPVLKDKAAHVFVIRLAAVAAAGGVEMVAPLATALVVVVRIILDRPILLSQPLLILRVILPLPDMVK
jgi:hypothetical protein